MLCGAKTKSLQFPDFLCQDGSLLGSANSERQRQEEEKKDLFFLFPVSMSVTQATVLV